MPQPDRSQLASAGVKVAEAVVYNNWRVLYTFPSEHGRRLPQGHLQGGTLNHKRVLARAW